MDRCIVNKILLFFIIVEIVLIAGVVGYRLGRADAIETMEQPVYNITLRVDREMIEYEEVDISESVEEIVETRDPVNDIAPTPGKVEISYPTNTKPGATPVVHIYTDNEVAYLAKTVWGEARGLSKTEQAAVVWTILNRVDDGRFGKGIVNVITAPKQFVGYKTSNPITAEIKEVVLDVLNRWEREKAGIEDVGRVLPKGYLYFRGNGKENLFSKSWNSKNVWDWSLESPY